MQEPTGRVDGVKRFAFRITPRDVEQGGIASAQLKRELREGGVSAYDARRAGIVAFEGEMNLIVHSERGGTIAVDVHPDTIDIVVEDDGPGIGDIDLALTPGYSTAPNWATELGFGAGMGLPNMQRNSDHFEIRSHIGRGTLVRSRIDRREGPLTYTAAEAAARAAAKANWASDLGVVPEEKAS